jgi:plastocyanin
MGDDTMRRALYGLLSLALVFGLVQCGGGDDGPTDPDPDPDPNQAPSVSITSPADGATFAAGAEITFEGSATDQEDGSLTGGSLTWSSDVDGQIGTGETVTTTTLAEGSHEITLEAEDSEGVTASASVGITIGDQAGGDVVDITIDDNVFIDPDGNENTDASVTIDLGQTVRWTYVSSGSTVHTVDSGEGVDGADGDGVPEGGTPISSGDITPGETFEFTPDAPGTWTYFCEVHPGIMYNATIIVNE